MSQLLAMLAQRAREIKQKIIENDKKIIDVSTWYVKNEPKKRKKVEQSLIIDRPKQY